VEATDQERRVGWRPRPSAAREHLANERTLLAWARTGVTLIALGFAAARFGAFLGEESSGRAHVDAATLIGLSLVAAGAASTGLALVRFLRARDQIAAGRFRAEWWPEALLAAVTAALGIGVVTYLLVRG
jgi:putative membrane protein